MTAHVFPTKGVLRRAAVRLSAFAELQPSGHVRNMHVNPLLFKAVQRNSNDDALALVEVNVSQVLPRRNVQLVDTDS